MIKKTLFIALAAFSINGFANGFEDSNFFQTSPDKITQSTYSQAYAKKEREGGAVARPINISSSHSVAISNPTNSPLSYRYIYSLCAANKGCLDKSFSITVQPNTTFRDSGKMEGKVAFGQRGSYTSWARTQIIGINRDYSDDQYSYNTIDVS